MSEHRLRTRLWCTWPVLRFHFVSRCWPKRLRPTRAEVMDHMVWRSTPVKVLASRRPSPDYDKGREG